MTDKLNIFTNLSKSVSCYLAAYAVYLIVGKLFVLETSPTLSFCLEALSSLLPLLLLSLVSLFSVNDRKMGVAFPFILIGIACGFVMNFTALSLDYKLKLVAFSVTLLIVNIAGYAIGFFHLAGAFAKKTPLRICAYCMAFYKLVFLAVFALTGYYMLKPGNYSESFLGTSKNIEMILSLIVEAVFFFFFSFWFDNFKED